MDASILIYNYITTNTLNGKQYIGMHSTTDVDDGYLGSGKLIKAAIQKYGKENFKREILEICEDVSIAYYNESLYIETYNTLTPNGYNISPTGGTHISGRHSEETKKKQSESHIGIFVGYKHTDISKQHMSDAAKMIKHKPCSEETKLKLSNSNKGKHIATDEFKSIISKVHKGKVLSKETKLKISINSKGRTAWNKGKKRSQETINRWRETIERKKVKS